MGILMTHISAVHSHSLAATQTRPLSISLSNSLPLPTWKNILQPSPLSPPAVGQPQYIFGNDQHFNFVFLDYMFIFMPHIILRNSFFTILCELDHFSSAITAGSSCSLTALHLVTLLDFPIQPGTSATYSTIILTEIGSYFITKNEAMIHHMINLWK